MILDPTFQKLKAHLIEVTGLAYYSQQDELLAKRVGKRLKATELALGEYELLLQRSAKELSHLVQEITLGESYFFRSHDQAKALEQGLLRRMLGERRHERRLQVWSAACARGEEPHSLTILLKDKFESALRGWKVEVLATDINAGYLEQARSGSYREWSLRVVEEDSRQRWFRRQGTSWQLRPRYREWVDFREHNLVQDPYPQASGGFDLILCRNVLMYFEPEVARRVCENLAQALAPGGVLLVGHADYQPLQSTRLVAVQEFGTNYYGLTGRTPVAEPVAPRPSVPRGPTVPAVKREHPPMVPLACALEVEELRLAIEAGHYQEAEQKAREGLKREPLEPALHMYLALSLHGQGRAQEARQSLEKSLFLDHKSVEAHFYSAVLHEANGQEGAAQRCYQNALGLLEGGAQGPAQIRAIIKNRLRESTR